MGKKTVMMSKGCVRITCLNQKVPGNITCGWREGQATGEPQSRDTAKDNVINVTTAAFDYKDSVKLQNRRVKK